MAESLWKRLGPAPLEVEDYELERLEQPVTRGFTRVTTVVHLRGGGHEGLGEDVTWFPEHHDHEQKAGPVLPLAGSWTLESFSDALDMPDPHRRWAYESAALDLALRQADTTLAAVAGREPRPIAFVVSPGLGNPPTSRVVLRWLELDQNHRFKLDPAIDWTDQLLRSVLFIAAPGNHDIADRDLDKNPDDFERYARALRRIGLDLAPAHRDGAGCRLDEAGDHPQDGRLAGARRPQQGDHLAVPHVQIDAVYRDGDDGWLVVDWKTGSSVSDPLQLSIYRLAWAELVGVPVEQVRAAFYYVRAGELSEPALLDRDGLEALTT